MSEEPKPMKCSKCKRPGLTTDDFHRYTTSKRGYQYECKRCVNDRTRNRVWSRQRLESHRKRKYGVSVERQRDMWRDQKGKCLICDVELEYAKAHLDHHHASSKVRGFLCSDCNWAVGAVRENPKSARRVAAYIQVFNSDHPNPHHVMLNIRDRNFKES